VAMPPFNPTESYNAALQLHDQEFRTLSERTNIFLISQSIFVAALALLLTSQQCLPVDLDIPALGIVIAGTLYCLLHHKAGLQGSRGALIWREYMLKIEAGNNNAPWKWFYKTYRSKQYSECLLVRPPLPSAWLVSPSIFMLLWLGAPFYVYFNHTPTLSIEELAKLHQTDCWLFAFLIIAAVVWLGTAICIAKGFIIWQCKQR
jgi:hypothetical protein